MLTGRLLRDMIISGANNIELQQENVNRLNVFPVPDGDTGLNMSLTLGAAAAELKNADGGAGEIADIAASALLRSARGNSGVIISLLFRGLAKGLRGKTAADGHEFACAFSLGVESAYKAVMKPTEGTILTVSRIAAEKAIEFSEKSPGIVEVLECMTAAARDTLRKTPDMLPILKQAKVVDAGGMGLCVVLEGMLSAARDGRVIQSGGQRQSDERADFGFFAEEDILFEYCTEFIIRRNDPYGDASALRTFLEGIGDSVLAVDDDDIIKVHVHTNNPGQALEAAVVYGPLTNIKIENMKEQHSERLFEAGPKIAAPSKKYGFVPVAAGEGFEAVFRDLGADAVVVGGQTMNPSTEDILQAVMATPAETVYVLPNNSNIILTAELCVPMAKDRSVIVIPTKTVPQGISAMMAFNEHGEPDRNTAEMTEAASNVRTGQVTYAARDSVFGGRQIKEGEILGLVDNKVTVVAGDIASAVDGVCDEIINGESLFVTLFYGSDVTEEQAQEIAGRISDRGGAAEVSVVYGGQPVYYYVISVE